MIAGLFDGATQQAQLLMVAGFVMLGWVLARRTIKNRKQVNRDARASNRMLKQIREHTEPAIPLCDAPAEIQRWQTAMFDLQRELKAELDTRIVIVQTLMQQVDQRITRLESMISTPLESAPSTPLESAPSTPLESMPSAPLESVHSTSTATAITGGQQEVVADLLRTGHSAQEIAVKTGLPLGDIEMAIATLGPRSGQ